MLPAFSHCHHQYHHRGVIRTAPLSANLVVEVAVVGWSLALSGAVEQGSGDGRANATGDVRLRANFSRLQTSSTSDFRNRQKTIRINPSASFTSPVFDVPGVDSNLMKLTKSAGRTDFTAYSVNSVTELLSKYNRSFTSLTHCSKCKNYMPRDSWVQRVFDSAFHVDCFTCALCNRQLQFGECIVFSQGEIFCAWHSYAHQPPPFAKAQTKPPPAGRDPVPLRDTYLDQALEEELVDEDGHPIGTEDISSPSKPNSISQPSSGSEITFDESHICEENSVNTVTPFTSFIQSHQQPQRSASRSIVGSQQRSKRIRTSFTPQQIAVLQASFKTVSNPDGQELERIAQATCLTKRVTQVWFQNARARKKKTVRNPDLQQQPNSPRQAMNCSGGGSGSGIGARRGGLAGDFVPNEALNDATDRVMESEADMWIPQSISPQLAATLEVPEPKPYFTKGGIQESCLFSW
ncbi:unnamed protein product [Mesocestoides corti]|uniref:Homeobox domain-containing protein n=1 Tax=Mesocestoides corti TaxID=53468 RepID=A0A158QTS2_MESCO|nr:unnamed protein product [Mesocestoides corti]